MFNCGIEWPPYSPEISCLDFFFWGYLKDKIYKDNPKTLAGIERRIREKILALEPEMLHRVVQGFEMRLRKLLTLEGQHIENIIH